MLILQPSCQSETFIKLLRLGLKYRTFDSVKALHEPTRDLILVSILAWANIHCWCWGVGGMQMQRLEIISEYGVGGKFLNKASFLYKLKCFIS